MTETQSETKTPTGRSVLITGAAGFIGSHLVERCLGAGDAVVGIDNFNDFYDPSRKRSNIVGVADHPSFTMVEADIRDRSMISATFNTHRPTHVVHLAAMAGVRASIERPAYYTDVNVDGTVSVLDAAVAHDVAQFVYASSSSVYGDSDKVPFSETDSADSPISPYAATKRAAELLCRAYAHLHRLPTICLRFFTVYGPRQRPDLAIHKFLRLLADNEPLPVYGDGSTSRDYTYIDDTIDGVMAAMERGTDKGGFSIYNLGSDRPVSLVDLIATIERVVGRAVTVDRRPMQPGDVTRTWADISRSERDLGYRPQVGLEDGIKRQWIWLAEQSADLKLPTGP